MFCPKCGSNLPDGASFCGQCGASLKRDVSAASGGSPSFGGEANAVGSTVAATSAKPWLKIAIPVVAIVIIAFFVFSVLGSCEPSIESGVTPKASVNDYTWDELSKISAEIGSKRSEDSAVEAAKKYNLVNADGKLDDTQTKTIQLTNGSTAVVQIAGFAHDEKTGGGKAGITFVFKDAIAEHIINSSDMNSGGWEASQMRSWLATDGLAMLPQDLSSKIVAVDKKTNNTGETDNASAVTTTSDKLWLFSFVELLGSSPFKVVEAEGNIYKLFKDCNDSLEGPNSVLTKRFSGSACKWWERSPASHTSNNFFAVSTEGKAADVGLVTRSNGVVPGFCI